MPKRPSIQHASESSERKSLLKDMYLEMLTPEFIAERRKEIRHVKGRGHVFTFVNLAGRNVQETEVEKDANFRFMLDYLASFTGNLPTQAEEVLAKVSSEKKLNNFDCFAKHEAWSIVEGGQHRALASYICNRCVRTKFARPGRSKMADLKQLVMTKLQEKGLLDDTGKKRPTPGRSRNLDPEENEDKKESTEAAPSRPDDLPEGERPAKRKKLKESYPPPDRLPSSEYCDSNTDDEEENENGVTLHEELHEELYGLPTPRKCVAREGSGEIAPTELEQSPDGELVDDTDDDDGVPLGQSAGQPSGDTTGAHKDTRPLTKEIAVLPDCSLQAQRQMKRAARTKEDPNEEQDEDSDAKYKDEAYGDGMPAGRRRGRGKGKGKSRGKGRGRPNQTTQDKKPQKEKADERNKDLEDAKPADDHSSPATPEPKEPKHKENNDEKPETDQEDTKKVEKSPPSDEAVCGTPQRKTKKNPRKEGKTRKNTPLKGRSPKHIKAAMEGTKRATPQEMLESARPSMRHFDPPEDFAKKKTFTVRHPHGHQQAADGLNVCSIGVMMDRGATFYLYKVPASRVQKFNELKLCPQPVAANKSSGVSLGWLKYGGVCEAWKVAMWVAGWRSLNPSDEDHDE